VKLVLAAVAITHPQSPWRGCLDFCIGIDFEFRTKVRSMKLAEQKRRIQGVCCHCGSNIAGYLDMQALWIIPGPCLRWLNQANLYTC
jgi:hypothetical protein